MLLLVVIIVLIILLSGGGFYGYNRRLYPAPFGLIPMVLIILLLIWLFSGFGPLYHY